MALPGVREGLRFRRLWRKTQLERYQDVLDKARTAHMKGDMSQAIHLYDKCLVFRPDDHFLLFCLGTAMSQTQQFGLAIMFLKRVTELKPDLADGWHNLGISYRTMGMIDQAVECYTQELKYVTKQAEVATIYSNWGGCYINEGDPERVLELCDKGLRYDETSAPLLNHKALALLELGRYREGFALYESRYRLTEFHRRDYGKAPRWDGSPVGKLAVHGEQGLGDEILFMTQIAKVLPLVEELALEVAPRLLGLVRHSFRNEPKVKVFPDDESLQKNFAADAWCAMGSLPLLVWPPTRSVYLEPSRAYFRSERPRLGISWRGGTLRTHEYHRNAPIEFWQPLVERVKGYGIEVISLQYGPAEDMAERLVVKHDAENIKDLDTLASMIRSCDHVLSVCNTTVHMAGALGVPTTCLVPSKPAWRYGLYSERSDWYDSVGYIRQGPGEDWPTVLSRTTKIMEEWAKDAYHRSVPEAQRAKA